VEKLQQQQKNLQKHKNLKNNKEFTFDLQIRMLHNACVHHTQRIKHKYKLKIKNNEKNCVYYVASMSTTKLLSYAFHFQDLMSFANPLA
jgi:hypothetical protein